MYARYLRFKSLYLKFKYRKLYLNIIKTKQKNCSRVILRHVFYIIELIFNQAER